MRRTAAARTILSSTFAVLLLVLWHPAATAQQPAPTLDPGGKAVAEVPSVAALLREREELRRENAALKRDLSVRDSYIQLSEQKLQLVLQQFVLDKQPDAAQSRCTALEEQLRALEKVDKAIPFDCTTLKFGK